MQPTEKVKHAKTAQQALESLMRLCARAERSSGDAMRLMASWQVPPQEREGVLQRLKADKFIDDRRYAEAFVREKINLSAWGRYKILAALRRKGIAESTVNEAMNIYERNDTADRLSERLERKARTVKYDTPYQLRTKLLRHGVSLGYSFDEVAQSVDTVMKKITNDTCDEDTFTSF